MLDVIGQRQGHRQLVPKGRRETVLEAAANEREAGGDVRAQHVVPISGVAPRAIVGRRPDDLEPIEEREKLGAEQAIERGEIVVEGRRREGGHRACEGS